MPFYVTIILTTLICAAGQFVQRTSGFGLGIVVMIVLPSLLASHGEATALANAVSIVGCIVVTVKYRKYISWKKVIAMSVPCMFFMLIAIMYMKAQTPDFLRRMLGVFLILMAAFFLFVGNRIRVRQNIPNAIIAGSLGGILSGLFSTGGPPVVVYLMSSGEELDKNVYIGTIQTYFMATGLYGLVVRAANGFFTINVLKLLPFAFLGMLIGILIGNRVFEKINARILKICVYIVMAISGIIMIFS